MGNSLLHSNSSVSPPVRRFDSASTVQPVLNSRVSEQFKQKLVLRSYNLPVVLEQSIRLVLPSIFVEQITDALPVGSREILTLTMSLSSHVLYRRDENLVFPGVPLSTLSRLCLRARASRRRCTRSVNWVVQLWRRNKCQSLTCLTKRFSVCYNDVNSVGSLPCFVESNPNASRRCTCHVSPSARSGRRRNKVADQSMSKR